MSLLDDLNPEQRQAATAIEGPVLIFAGAGSGKTRALTYRIAYMVSQGIPAHNILAVTFTNKAAGEMRGRVYRLVGEKARGIWVGTFHAACARILRADGEAVGVDPRFVVYDEGDQLSLVRQVLREADYDPQHYKPADILNAIGRAKDELIGPDQLRRDAKRPYERVVAHVYRLYQRELAANKALDFDDIIVKTVELFEQHPDILARWQDRFRYVLVDEYQDINYAQYRFVNLLASRERNICVVGDDDQSIYGWRGANVRLILRFREDYPEARVVYLERNYRSTQRILECANAVISRNEARAPKKLWTTNPMGERAVLYTAIDEREEGEWVAGLVRSLEAEGYRAGDVAVLYRTNAMSRSIEDALVRAKIPYRVVGGVRFYERAETKDMLAYLRLLHNPADSVSARRIVNRPPRRIGKKTVQQLEELAGSQGCSFMDACRRLASQANSRPQAREALTAFVELIDHLREAAAEQSLTELVRTVAEDTGYLDWLRSSSSAEDQARAENVEEFVTLAAEFERTEPEANLSTFLEHVALMTDIDEAGELGDGVTLMTLHAAKGLEFPVIVICGLEEDLFPHERSKGNEAELEEERRLCYVGITRAKERLFLSYCRNRTIYGRLTRRTPSRFLGELPAEHIVFEGAEVLPGMVGIEGGEEKRAPGGPARDRQIDLVNMVDGARRSARRLTARQGVQAAQPAGPEPPPEIPEALREGARILHPVLGRGTVVEIEQRKQAPLVCIAFDGKGIKRIPADHISADWIQ